MHKVSVIIPVYNGERYLRECLDSVCRQSLEDIEIICVDDGSTDSSCEIIREYMEKDSRFSLYQQKNLYAGIARNNGLSHADGEYIAFWDCDDYFEPDALECMYNRAKKVDADICLCKATGFDDQRNLRKVRNRDADFRKMPGTDWFNLETNEDYILNCTSVMIWAKLFRRAFLERIHLQFVDARHAQDIWFSCIALCSAEKITAVDKSLINYRMRSENSISFHPDQEDATMMLNVCRQTVQYLKEHDIFPERSFVNRVLGMIQTELRRYGSISKQLEFIEYLQANCLEEFCIRPRPSEYYHSQELEEIATHLLADSPEGFLGFLNQKTAAQLSIRTMQLSAQKEEVKKLRKQLKKQERSNSAWFSKFIKKLKPGKRH